MGISRPGTERQMIRVRTNCWTLTAGGDVRERVGRRDLAARVQQLNRESDSEIGSAIHRHLDVRLEPRLVVDRGQHRRRRDAIPFAHRDVADDSGGRRGDAVVLQLHASLAYLRVERGEIGLRAFEVVLRRVELVLADRSRLQQ